MAKKIDQYISIIVNSINTNNFISIINKKNCNIIERKSITFEEILEHINTKSKFKSKEQQHNFTLIFDTKLGTISHYILEQLYSVGPTPL